MNSVELPVQTGANNRVMSWCSISHFYSHGQAKALVCAGDRRSRLQFSGVVNGVRCLQCRCSRRRGEKVRETERERERKEGRAAATQSPRSRCGRSVRKEARI